MSNIEKVMWTLGHATVGLIKLAAFTGGIVMSVLVATRMDWGATDYLILGSIVAMQLFLSWQARRGTNYD